MVKMGYYGYPNYDLLNAYPMFSKIYDNFLRRKNNIDELKQCVHYDTYFKIMVFRTVDVAQKMKFRSFGLIILIYNIMEIKFIFRIRKDLGFYSGFKVFVIIVSIGLRYILTL